MSLCRMGCAVGCLKEVARVGMSTFLDLSYEDGSIQQRTNLYAESSFTAHSEKGLMFRHGARERYLVCTCSN